MSLGVSSDGRHGWYDVHYEELVALLEFRLGLRPADPPELPADLPERPVSPTCSTGRSVCRDPESVC